MRPRKARAAGRDVQDIEFTIDAGVFTCCNRALRSSPRGSAPDRGRPCPRRRSLTKRRRCERLDARAGSDRCSARGSSEEPSAEPPNFANGEGASPGVGIGLAVGDSDESERPRASAGEAVVLARPTTSPDDLHGMIVARAVVTERGGSTSHAAVVGRALGLPCVVGCGAGALAASDRQDGHRRRMPGKVFQGALPIETPNENDNALLAVLAKWAAKRSPLRIVAGCPGRRRCRRSERGRRALLIPRIGEVISALKPAKGARGRLHRVGRRRARRHRRRDLEFIVADPVLPALLEAAEMKLETIPASKQKETL